MKISLLFAVDLTRKAKFQKQPPEVFYKKNCSKNFFRKIHRKTPRPATLLKSYSRTIVVL